MLELRIHQLLTNAPAVRSPGQALLKYLVGPGAPENSVIATFVAMQPACLTLVTFHSACDQAAI
jgi:hypothetical protein